MSKLIKKTAETALHEVSEALDALADCKDEISKGLTCQTYVDIANHKLSDAITHMQEAKDWLDALVGDDDQ